MLFSSIGFLYAFLPLLLIFYGIVPNRFRNIVLLVFSVVFYGYGEPRYLLVLAASILSGYCHGRWISRLRTGKWSKFPLVSSIVISLGFLFVFKYADFVLDTVTKISGWPLTALNLALPLGISFYTFQIISYLVDVYRGDTPAERNFLNFATYVSLFPQLIAGPIVRYTTVSQELSARTHSYKLAAGGARRFLIGLAKKVLIANTLAELGKSLSQQSSATVLMAWLQAIAFMLQIYYDFSGYSDMAIGLGKIFGFHYLENFDYPLTATSITDFWRHWHRSLGTWFRDYLYIPMGGNRVKLVRWVVNILVVWLLTGFWHGAGWNFIIWGLYFAILLIIEKLLLNGPLKQMPGILRRIGTLLLLVISFAIFNSDSLHQAMEQVSRMLLLSDVPFSDLTTRYYASSFAVTLLIAAIGATPYPARVIKHIVQRNKQSKWIAVAEPVGLVTMLILITAFLIDGSFNPFLYFRF